MPAHLTWRHAAAAALLGAGLIAANGAHAAVMASFSSTATVEVVLLDEVPLDAIVEHEGALFSSSASADGALSSASSTPEALPAYTDMLQDDGTYQNHSDVGEAGAVRGVPTGLASASSSTDGYVYVENNTGTELTLGFEWAIDALLSTGLVQTTDGEGAASAFANVLIQVGDGFVYDDITTLDLTASLDTNPTADYFDFAEFDVVVPDGEFREITITVNTGGTANAVPVPATLGLMALGLLGLRRFGWGAAAA